MLPNARHRQIALVLGGACMIAAAPAAPPVAPLAPAKVKEVGKAHAEGLLGQAVTDPKGDTVGHVVDVLIEPDGIPNAAVVEFAGFFGLGNRQIAVDWKALNFSVKDDHIVIRLDLDADKLKAMPEYKSEASSVSVATPAKK